MNYMPMHLHCGVPVLITDVGVGDGVVEGVHPKCILAVLFSLMNVIVLTTIVTLHLVPH